MFQFVDTLDCNSAGSAYLVNLYGGMRVVVQNQFGGAFYRLGYRAHAVPGVKRPVLFRPAWLPGYFST